MSIVKTIIRNETTQTVVNHRVNGRIIAAILAKMAKAKTFTIAGETSDLLAPLVEGLPAGHHTVVGDDGTQVNFRIGVSSTSVQDIPVEESPAPRRDILEVLASHFATFEEREAKAKEKREAEAKRVKGLADSLGLPGAEADRLGAKVRKAENAASYLPNSTLEISTKVVGESEDGNPLLTYNLQQGTSFAPNSLLDEVANYRNLWAEDHSASIQIIPMDDRAAEFPRYIVEPLLQEGYLCIKRRKLLSPQAVAAVFAPIFQGDDDQLIPGGHTSLKEGDSSLPAYDSKQGVVDMRAYSASLTAALVPGSFMPDTVACVTQVGRWVGNEYRPYGADGAGRMHPSICHQSSQFRGINLIIALLAKGMLIPDEKSYVLVVTTTKVEERYWRDSAGQWHTEEEVLSTSTVATHGMTGEPVPEVHSSWKAFYSKDEEKVDKVDAHEASPEADVWEQEVRGISTRSKVRVSKLTRTSTKKLAVVTFDHLNFKGRWKGYLKAERKANPLAVDMCSMDIGFLRQWHKPGSSKSCFEQVEKYRISKRSIALMERLLRKAMSKQAKMGIDKLIDSAIRGNLDKEFLVKDLRAAGVNPMLVDSISNPVQDRLAKLRHLLAQGLGIKLPSKVVAIDNTMEPDVISYDTKYHMASGFVVTSGEAKGLKGKVNLLPQAGCVSRYPAISDSAFVNRRIVSGYNHQMICKYQEETVLMRKVIVDGCETFEYCRALNSSVEEKEEWQEMGETWKIIKIFQRSLMSMPKETAFGHEYIVTDCLQGDDDGDTVLISSDPDLMELTQSHMKRVKAPANRLAWHRANPQVSATK